MELKPGSSDGRLGYLAGPPCRHQGPRQRETGVSEAERGVTAGAKVRKGGGKMLFCWL